MSWDIQWVGLWAAMKAAKMADELVGRWEMNLVEQWAGQMGLLLAGYLAEL